MNNIPNWNDLPEPLRRAIGRAFDSLGSTFEKSPRVAMSACEILHGAGLLPRDVMDAVERVLDEWEATFESNRNTESLDELRARINAVIAAGLNRN